MKILSISLNEDLHLAALKAAGDKSILVYPTRSSANNARRRELENWQLQERSFISMQDFKEAIVLPDTAELTDEKRLLCLYLVMGEEQRSFFHILSYEDIVQWGTHFFEFFEELAEECVDVGNLEELKDSGVFHLQMWQELYLERILQIRSDYGNYIGALGYTDKIFYLHPGSFHDIWSDNSIVFVNQYYYSALEKELIRRLETLGNRITIIYQGMSAKQNENDWNPLEFDLYAAWKDLKVKPVVRIIESENEDQMALAFLSCSTTLNLEQKSAAIIDSSFHTKSYKRYFDRQRFRLPNIIPFTQSTVYKMLSAILNSLKAMQISGGYLPISIMAKLLSTDWFLPYFVGLKQQRTAFGDDTAKLEEMKTEIWRELTELIEKDCLYVDLPMFEGKERSFLRPLLSDFFVLLKAFGAVGCINDLCALIDSPGGVQTAYLISEKERDYTDILPCFWDRMANFAAIESLELIPSWQQIYSEQNCATGILELLISFLGSAKINVNLTEVRANTWEISNLLDARNRSFCYTAFFQLIEGIVPSNPSPVWLFNETQRAKLGLKTYSDVRAWERYYFFRLLLTSQEAMCFTYRNLERDISPSSFIGEIEQLFSDLNNNGVLQEEFHYPVKKLYESRYCSSMEYSTDAEICSIDSIPDAGFFVLPCEPDKDFGSERTLQASASSILQLVKNPFLWYIETYSHIQPKPWEAPETISSKLFGNIMHAYFAKLLGNQRGHHSGLEELDSIFGNPDKLQQGLTEIINSSEFKYQIPKNYNADFLNEIISERLSDSLYQFYDSWLKNRLERREFALIPEESRMTHAEGQYKHLGSVLASAEEYHISLRGKADLRIETDSEAMIIDFKTGKHDYRQLIIYEWVYYLLDSSWPEESINSRFWDILDPSPSVDKIDSAKRGKLKEEILSVYLDCLTGGFCFGKKASDRQRMKNITRADLYVANKEEADA